MTKSETDLLRKQNNNKVTEYGNEQKDINNDKMEFYFEYKQIKKRFYKGTIRPFPKDDNYKDYMHICISISLFSTLLCFELVSNYLKHKPSTDQNLETIYTILFYSYLVLHCFILVGIIAIQSYYIILFYFPNTKGMIIIAKICRFFGFTPRYFNMYSQGKMYNKHNNILYNGCYVNDYKEGFGISYNYKAGGEFDSYYAGQWKKNKKNGYGVLYDANHNVIYKGDWQNNKKSGIGHSNDCGGLVQYIGEMKDDMQHGLGEEYIYDNDKFYLLYDGNFKENSRHEFGKSYTLTTHELSYEGEYNHNRKQGEGKQYQTYYSFNHNDDLKPQRMLYYSGKFAKGQAADCGKRYYQNGRVLQYKITLLAQNPLVRPLEVIYSPYGELYYYKSQ